MAKRKPMTKKQFLKNKINELQQEIWQAEIEIKRGEFLANDLKMKLDKLKKHPTPLKPQENPLNIIDQKKRVEREVEKGIMDIITDVELLKHKTEADKRFLKILKRELKKEEK